MDLEARFILVLAYKHISRSQAIKSPTLRQSSSDKTTHVTYYRAISIFIEQFIAGLFYKAMHFCRADCDMYAIGTLTESILHCNNQYRFVHDVKESNAMPLHKWVCALTVPDPVHKCKQFCLLKALDLGYGHYEHTMQPDL